jgi:hypothetical protein
MGAQLNQQTINRGNVATFAYGRLSTKEPSTENQGHSSVLDTVPVSFDSSLKRLIANFLFFGLFLFPERYLCFTWQSRPH